MTSNRSRSLGSLISEYSCRFRLPSRLTKDRAVAEMLGFIESNGEPNRTF